MNDALALAAQVRAGDVRGREEPRREVIRHHPVDLFRHGAIEAAQSGLDVGDRNVQLGGGQGAGKGGVGVAVDQDGIRPLLLQHRFNCR